MSELKPAGTCNASTTTDCKRTIYAYTGGGQVDTINEKGFTYNSSGSVVAYDFTTDHSYDGNGRITSINGPRTDTSYDTVSFTYYSSGERDPLDDYQLKEVKRQTGSATYVTTTYEDYDEWGNPTSGSTRTGEDLL